MTTAQPAWVCDSCGTWLGRSIPRLATYHRGICGICGDVRSVTEPRDYGYLDMDKSHNPTAFVEDAITQEEASASLVDLEEAMRG